METLGAPARPGSMTEGAVSVNNGKRPGTAALSVRSRLTVAVGLLVAAAVVFLSSPSSDAPELVTGTGPTPHAGEAMWGVGRGQTASFGEMFVCLDRPGRITITSVRGHEATRGFRVDAFAVHPNPFWSANPDLGGMMLGSAHGTLTANHFPPGSRALSLTCDHHNQGRGYELGVQLTNTAGGIASAHGFDISYLSRGQRKMLLWPLSVALCPGNQSQSCRDVVNGP